MQSAKMTDTVYIINPNSTETVTHGIDAAMAPLRIAGGPGIEPTQAAATMALGRVRFGWSGRSPGTRLHAPV